MLRNKITSALGNDRPYAGPQDLQFMLDLLRNRPPSRAADFPGFIDLREMLADLKIQAATHLWFDPADYLLGFAFLDIYPSSAQLAFEFAPGASNPLLHQTLLAWVETLIKLPASDSSGTFLLESNTSSDDPVRIAMLERLGFELQAEGSVHLQRNLADPISQAYLPEGFIIRPIQGEAEAVDWVRLHHAALGTRTMTVDYKLAMMRTSAYDPELDLVVQTPDGRLAAYCVCYINIEENAITGQKNAYTDPIATHPDFQRRGLSKALLLTGLFLLKDRGLDTASLGTSTSNLPMLRTAGSVGFQIKQRVLFYQKTIPCKGTEMAKSV